jgi:TatD DNase family protein
MGLDYHYDFSPREQQVRAFRAQLQAARENGMPVIIHDRESGGETMEILDQERAWETGVLFHCYTGDAAMMKQIVDRGGYISIPGIVTFKNAEAMREVARTAPLSRILIETDSPYLAPVPYRGKRNEPAWVPLVGAAVAALRGMPADELCSAAAANTLRFYRWD